MSLSTYTEGKARTEANKRIKKVVDKAKTEESHTRNKVNEYRSPRHWQDFLLKEYVSASYGEQG